MAGAIQTAPGDRDITKFASLVARSNLASLKSCYRLGWTSLGNMTIVGGKRRSIRVYPKAAKELGICFGRKCCKRNENGLSPQRNNIMQVLSRMSLRAVYGPFRASGNRPAVYGGSGKYQ